MGASDANLSKEDLMLRVLKPINSAARVKPKKNLSRCVLSNKILRRYFPHCFSPRLKFSTSHALTFDSVWRDFKVSITLLNVRFREESSTNM